MKLTKIYFDAFKSLLNKELEINHDCIGFVGTNESGKSNVLLAINALSGNRKLTASDTPKMDKTNNPSLRFLFQLTKKENEEVENIIKDWCQQNTLANSKSIEYSELQICYNIIFNKEKNQEERFFTIDGFKLESTHLVLLFDKLIDSYKIKDKESFVSLNKAIILKESNLVFNKKHHEVYNQIDKINNEIIEQEKQIQNITEREAILNEKFKENEPNIATPEGTALQSELTKEKEIIKLALTEESKKIEVSKNDRDGLLAQVSEFNITELINGARHSITNGEQDIANIKAEITLLQNQVAELKKVAPSDTAKINIVNKSITDLTSKLKDTEEKKNTSPKLLEDLIEPLEQKYSKESSELNKHLSVLIQQVLITFLPKVVFWEHSPKFILSSETSFAELLTKKDLNEISRPLVNVFRIGLNIKSIEELKAKIKEIQTDGSERSRYMETLNEKINEYIGRVWADYDQDVKISLEKDQIRIQIFDPNRKGASFYNMEERSQGCKTFLSFLLTISVEAEHGVIKNTILLLDEPETHLHPSGVRFMLQQLIKIADKGNQVIYATHSIFLIDRNKFDRHIILKKEKENTIIKPSNVGRIGYFMQEEVLYSTLDLNLDSDFSSTNECNFVFEGDGDVILFSHYYENILTKENRPFPIKSTSFHQGGKCTDIQKYLINRAIQLGTKWVFILDSDKPGNELKRFIEGKYKDYLNRDIFVFQYTNTKKKNNNIELEDIFTVDFIIETFMDTAKQLKLSITQKEIEKQISEEDNFANYYEAVIKKLVRDDKPDVFKGKFKEVLNARIRKSIQDIKDEETLKKSYPDYFKWVTDMTAKLTAPKK